MQPVATKKQLWQKQMPTMMGLSVLIIGLVAGLLFFSQGTGVFAPRASAETTPKNIKITNVADKSFTVSFYTDQSTAGFVKYGTEPGSLRQQAGDDRDQLSGAVGQFTLHHITVRGLEPGKTYYFVLGTGSNSTFDKEGQPFSVTTAKAPTGPLPANQTVYGSVANPGGTPAEGAIVYLTKEGIGEMSALVKASGSWAIPLSTAFSKDGSAYATFTEADTLTILAQGTTLNQTTTVAVPVSQAMPVPNLTLGKQTQLPQASSSADLADNTDLQATAPATYEEQAVATAESEVSSELDNGVGGVAAENRASDSGETVSDTLNRLVSQAEPPQPTATPEPTQAPEPTATPETTVVSEPVGGAVETINLETIEQQTEPVVAVSKPVIQGIAPPKVPIRISVHSDNQIEQTVVADENGNFELDLAQMSEGLEPGEHTVTYSYTDPQTGEEVTKTHTFMVAGTGGASRNLIAQADTTNDDVPYGSGNPYPVDPTPTVEPTVEPTPEPEVTLPATGSATRSAVVSTTSGVYQSGSVSTTFALILGGLFFIFTGAWSWWVAGQAREE